MGHTSTILMQKIYAINVYVRHTKAFYYLIKTSLVSFSGLVIQSWLRTVLQVIVSCLDTSQHKGLKFSFLTCDYYHKLDALKSYSP